MKIYILPVDEKLQPTHQNYVWPPQNNRLGEDRGVEQDFLQWINSHPELLVDNPSDADWLYLPIFWNRVFINIPDEEGHWGGGVELLSEHVYNALQYEMPVFTISEADEFDLHPQIDWEDLTMFISSRRGNKGINIPLLSASHILPEVIPEKKYLASFVGSLITDGAREMMQDKLSGRDDCWVEHGGNGEEYFVNLMLESYIALCPRGKAAQSYRFYEAMQLGVVPLYISDEDCRPFRNWIDWDICSFWLTKADNISEYLDALNHKGKLLRMGCLAKYTYDEFLGYGKWCRFVVKELELL